MGDQDRSTQLDEVHASKGMTYLTHKRQRAFTFNIFQMNSQELLDVTRRVNDPEEGLRLMTLDNQAAGEHIHREVTRRIHNFVAAALTLVEHTRIFIREHYSSSSISIAYQKKIDDEFANDPLAKFVQGLRNYMLHNGLPPSEMYLQFSKQGQEGGRIETGVRLRTDKILEWEKWTAGAREYLVQCGEYIDIHSFAAAYTEKAISLNIWLQATLEEFHSADIENLQSLQASIGRPETVDLTTNHASQGTAPNQNDEQRATQEFTFTRAHADLLDSSGATLLRKIQRINLAAGRKSVFPSKRPTGIRISAQDSLAPPLFWGNDISGRRAFVFIYNEGGTYGLDEAAFAEMQTLTESVLNAKWANQKISQSFVENTVVKWLQVNFQAATLSSLSETIEVEARNAVASLELWVPIAHLEVQTPFSVGPTEITPISEELLGRLEEQGISYSPNQRAETSQLFHRLRKRMQGLAAVVYKLDAEPGKIEEDGLALAEVVIAFIRFFSPAALRYPSICANAILGAERSPSSNLLIIGNDSFSYKESCLSPDTPDWQISDRALQRIRPQLDAAGTLVRPEGLNNFEKAVRTSLLLFSTGTTFFTPIERLSYCLSALESLLLRHFAEPAEHNVAERAGLLLTENLVERNAINRSIRNAYRLRGRQDISPLLPHDENSVSSFVKYTHAVVSTALANIGTFTSVAGFVYAINRSDGE